MPNVPKRSKKKSSKSRSRTSRTTNGPVRTAIPGTVPFNFHGSYKAATKSIEALDLGIAVGTILFVDRIDFEYTVDQPSTVAVSVTDFCCAQVADIGGPRSSNHLAVDNSRGRISFKNPNPRVYFQVVEANDTLATLHSSNAGATVSFSGTLWLALQGSTSHNIS